MQTTPKADPRFTDVPRTAGAGSGTRSNSQTPVSNWSDKALMGRVWWWLVIGPAVRLAELQGWVLDRRARHNFGEVE